MDKNRRSGVDICGEVHRGGMVLSDDHVMQLKMDSHLQYVKFNMTYSAGKVKCMFPKKLC